MCRNIRVLHNFQPPTTPEEIHAAALQYVRKVSGSTRPSAANQVAFDAAVTSIAAITTALLDKLDKRGEPRTREGELAKARARWEKRSAREGSRASGGLRRRAVVPVSAAGRDPVRSRRCRPTIS